jgi:hypothetical protein
MDASRDQEWDRLRAPQLAAARVPARSRPSKRSHRSMLIGSRVRWMDHTDRPQRSDSRCAARVLASSVRLEKARIDLALRGSCLGLSGRRRGGKSPAIDPARSSLAVIRRRAPRRRGRSCPRAGARLESSPRPSDLGGPCLVRSRAPSSGSETVSVPGSDSVRPRLR